MKICSTFWRKTKKELQHVSTRLEIQHISIQRDDFVILSRCLPKLCILILQNLDYDNKEIFITNFQLYLMSGNDVKKYVVDLYNVFEWIGTFLPYAYIMLARLAAHR
jgi:hypothetical protein